MKVIIAEEAGFCFGVKRALKLINQLHARGQDVQIYGQLIHNKIVLKGLEQKGIQCVDSLEAVDKNKTLVIRTHGIPHDLELELKMQEINVMDATCPLVKKTQKIIKRINPQKTFTVIVGDKNHPEIVAIKSYCHNGVVINSEEEAEKIKPTSKITVVAQTTLDSEFFKKIVSILIEKAEQLLHLL